MHTTVLRNALAAMAAAGTLLALGAAHEADVARDRIAACQKADAIAQQISNDARVNWSELQAIANLYGSTSGKPSAQAAADVEAPIAAREKRVQKAQIEWATARAACYEK